MRKGIFLLKIMRVVIPSMLPDLIPIIRYSFVGTYFSLVFQAQDIEYVTKFSAFCNPLPLNSLWSGYFFELADNGPSGCTPVVTNDKFWRHKFIQEFLTFCNSWEGLLSCVRNGLNTLTGLVQES